MEARAEYVTVADPMDSPGKPGTSSSYNSSSNVSVDFGMYGNSLYVPKQGSNCYYMSKFYMISLPRGFA